MALPQPLHIFRKDLTHLWPETLFVVGLFAIFCYAAPSVWADSPYIILIQVLSLPLKFLMVVSWLVLISRAIQDESLVGDRQFWTSRPYHWANLLASKVLLIFTCIYVPFFLMQLYLLHHAGLHPTLVLGDLFHNLLLLTVVVVIPLAALSAVTSTLPRVLLSFIGALVYVGILIGIVVWARFLNMQTPHLDWILNTIFIALPAAALIYQYKTRKTLVSRLILAVTPLLAFLIVLLVPSTSIIEKSYPTISGPKLTGLSDRLRPQTPPTGQVLSFQNHVPITLPVGVEGIDKDDNFLVRGIRAVITSPGFEYRSPFLSSLSAPQITGERPVAVLNFIIPKDVFDKVHLQPVTLHLELASEQLKAEKPSTWKATLLPFSVPGNGICSFPSDDARPGSAPTCRYPLKQPEIGFVTADLAASSCAQPAAPPVKGQANVGAGLNLPVDFDPVVTSELRFQTGDPNPQHRYLLCPGSKLDFVSATKLPDATVVLDQKNLILDPFAQRRPDPATEGQGKPTGQQPADAPEPQ